MGYMAVGICIIVVLAVAAPLTGCSYLSSPEPSSNAKLAPDIRIRDVFGQPFSLKENLGKVVVINFWASSCPPCLIEMPEFQAVQDRLKGNAIILSISHQDSVAFIRDFISKRGYTWLFASDQNGDTAIAYGVTYLPTTVFIDVRGRLVLTQIGGPINRVFLESAISKVSALN
jgi:thiol-disulfide isomerase/thioredoxin